MKTPDIGALSTCFILVCITFVAIVLGDEDKFDSGKRLVLAIVDFPALLVIGFRGYRLIQALHDSQQRVAILEERTRRLGFIENFPSA